MLIDIKHVEHFYIICGSIDFRKGIEGCVRIVSRMEGLDLFQNPYFSSVIEKRCNKSTAL